MAVTMRQVAPWPAELADLVERTKYRRNWRVWLEDRVRDPASTHGAEGAGLTLVIQTFTFNSYDQDERVAVNHFFIVPAATYDKRSWRRWLLEQFIKVEVHEACEFFSIDGEFPYAPSHGPGNDPYMVRELGTELDQRTKFTGELLAE